MAPIVLLDVNVLYPSLIRNLLMHCAEGGLIAARWTAAIHDEWIRNLLADRPDLSADRLQRTRRLMEETMPDAEAVGYEEHMAELDLPDPDDAHVLAAAIEAGAEYLITQNLKDFPEETLERYGIEALTPDDLLCRLYEAQLTETIRVLEKLRQNLHHPPYNQQQFQERLRQVGLTQLIAILQKD